MFERTPVVWAYWPIRMLARLGQHRGVVMKAFENSTPEPPSSARVSGMMSLPKGECLASVVSQR
jgi:hypothetical protein